MIATEPPNPENQIEFVLQKYSKMVYRLAYVLHQNPLQRRKSIHAFPMIVTLILGG